MLSRKTYNLKPKTYNFRGFTLLELLVVLAIMALLTAMSAPAISGYLRGARLRGGARQVASALRLARQLAITERRNHTVHFNIDDRQFWVEQVGVLVGERRTLPDTIDFHPPLPSYTFTARGTGTLGSIRIVNPNNEGMEIRVTGATGRVKVYPWSP